MDLKILLYDIEMSSMNYKSLQLVISHEMQKYQQYLEINLRELYESSILSYKLGFLKILKYAIIFKTSLVTYLHTYLI